LSLGNARVCIFAKFTENAMCFCAEQLESDIDGVHKRYTPAYTHGKLNGCVDARQTLNRGTRTLISRNGGRGRAIIVSFSVLARFHGLTCALPFGIGLDLWKRAISRIRNLIATSFPCHSFVSGT